MLLCVTGCDNVPAHGTGCVPVKPGSDALLAEYVLTVKHCRLVVSVLANGTVASAGLDLVLAWCFTISKIKSSILLHFYHLTNLVDCISLEHASFQLLRALTKIFPLTTM